MRPEVIQNTRVVRTSVVGGGGGGASIYFVYAIKKKRRKKIRKRVTITNLMQNFLDCAMAQTNNILRSWGASAVSSRPDLICVVAREGE